MLNQPDHVSSYTVNHYSEITSNDSNTFGRKQHVSKADGSIDWSKAMTLNVLIGKLLEIGLFVLIDDTTKCLTFEPFDFNEVPDLTYHASDVKPITHTQADSCLITKFLYVTSSTHCTSSTLSSISFDSTLCPGGWGSLLRERPRHPKRAASHGMANGRMASLSHRGSRFVHAQEVHPLFDELKGLEPAEYFKRVAEYADALTELTGERFTEHTTTLAHGPHSSTASASIGCVNCRGSRSGSTRSAYAVPWCGLVDRSASMRTS